ncbi:Enamine deaminase RidA, house cleaning of reactive enamine intermediates, YjgF/YER057c/UK114 family [Pseudomonas sp. ok272]|uniref:RidA family protein n=1 Tax=unclassified Pseudomonas TaxID=196821 RepID=UPI0008B2DA74|nr:MULTISPECIES: RidA family protein [unclassified Pseudomonas]SEN28702.1 Enamine deaminase RidA, house cleaning of reactive enamine intermediates, YjgF/YER057c/UK114 family [Pseudomonas sp. ok272]SFN21019.1 Enamine deaminase RidA, house cleaning of reactive enamine intermediates, YjgF/YER057c/UK114 family [Pseudomonas sp. ok602]
MDQSRQALFDDVARHLGHRFDGELRIGGNYVPAVRNGNQVYVSGQIPRIDNTVMVVGRVGAEVSLEQGQHAAKICTMRALAILAQMLGDLECIDSVLRINVYVRSDAEFSQQSEVADGASAVLYAIFADAGRHTRTSVGVFQLPKGAAVEVDMIVALKPGR